MWVKNWNKNNSKISLKSARLIFFFQTKWQGNQLKKIKMQLIDGKEQKESNIKQKQ